MHARAVHDAAFDLAQAVASLTVVRADRDRVRKLTLALAGAHDRRVTELLEANKAVLERARRAEARVTTLIEKLGGLKGQKTTLSGSCPLCFDETEPGQECCDGLCPMCP